MIYYLDSFSERVCPDLICPARLAALTARFDDSSELPRTLVDTECENIMGCTFCWCADEAISTWESCDCCELSY